MHFPILLRKHQNRVGIAVLLGISGLSSDMREMVTRMLGS